MTKEQWQEVLTKVIEFYPDARLALEDIISDQKDKAAETAFPKHGEEYWYVSSRLIAWKDIHTNEKRDREKIEAGNCFRSREEAAAQAMRWKALLPKYRPNEGDTFYKLCYQSGAIVLRKWCGDFCDWWAYYYGGTFRTKEEAEEWKSSYMRYFRKGKNDE